MSDYPKTFQGTFLGHEATYSRLNGYIDIGDFYSRYDTNNELTQRQGQYVSLYAAVSLMIAYTKDVDDFVTSILDIIDNAEGDKDVIRIMIVDNTIIDIDDFISYLKSICEHIRARENFDPVRHLNEENALLKNTIRDQEDMIAQKLRDNDDHYDTLNNAKMMYEKCARELGDANRALELCAEKEAILRQDLNDMVMKVFSLNKEIQDSKASREYARQEHPVHMSGQ